MAILDDIRNFLSGGKPVSPVVKQQPQQAVTFGNNLIKQVSNALPPLQAYNSIVDSVPRIQNAISNFAVNNPRAANLVLKTEPAYNAVQNAMRSIPERPVSLQPARDYVANSGLKTKYPLLNKIANAPMNIATNVGTGIVEGIANAPTQMIHNAYRFPQAKTPQEALGRAAGIVEPVLSMATPRQIPGLINKASSQPVFLNGTQKLLGALKEGAGTGAQFGGLFGGLQGIQQNADADNILDQMIGAVPSTVMGATVGGIIGAGTAGAGQIVKSTTDAIQGQARVAAQNMASKIVTTKDSKRPTWAKGKTPQEIEDYLFKYYKRHINQGGYIDPSGETDQSGLLQRDKKLLGIEDESPVLKPVIEPPQTKSLLEGELRASQESIPSSPKTIPPLKTLEGIKSPMQDTSSNVVNPSNLDINTPKSQLQLPQGKIGQAGQQLNQPPSGKVLSPDEIISEARNKIKPTVDKKTTPPMEPLQAGKIPDLKAQIASARSNLLEQPQSQSKLQPDKVASIQSESVPSTLEKPISEGSKIPMGSKTSEEINPYPETKGVYQNPSEEIIPRDQVPASNLNVNRLDLNPEQQSRVTDSQVKELRDVLGDKEVERIAKGAGFDTKTHTTEQQAKKIAEQLNVRRQVVELENQRTQLLSSGGTPEQLTDITRQIAERSRISREQGTEIARQLAARRIIANEINTPMQRVFQLLDQAGINPDVYAKDAATLDFRDGNAVIDFYRKYVPANRWDWIDLVRYNSMLSSPSTFINNFSSNLQGSALVAPVEKTITGGLDAIKSALTGSPRESYAGEGPAYAKGYLNSLSKAKDNFVNVMTGKNLSANPDYREIPLTQSGGRFRKIEDSLKYPMQLLEATDQFFTTLTKGGVEESLNYRAAKGGKTGDIGLMAEAESAKRLFRSKLGDNNGSHVLNALDLVANTIQKYKSSKNPVISTIAKYSLPFVQTPTNVLKQGLEYSLPGVVTMWGSDNKTEQLSKAIMGTSIATGVATMLGTDRLTWAEPTSDKQKAAFRAAGMQPYAVKIGDKWVSYTKLHPAIAFNLALVSAIKNAEDNKDLDENQVQSLLKGAAKWVQFFADQSYVKSIGDLLKTTQGDVEAPARLVGNYAQQLVPFRALSGWVARILDPYQRKVNPDENFLQQQFDYLKTQIPLLSQTVPAREDQYGDPIKNQNGLLNAVSPARITIEKPSAVEDFKFLQEQSKLDKEKRQLKEKFMKEAEKATTVEKVGAAESADVAGKGLPSTTTSDGKKLEGPGSYKTPQVVQTESLSKFQKDKVKTYLEYGKAVPEKDLINYYLGDIDKPANSSNYEKTIHQRELLKMYDKVSEDESLSKEQKSSVQKAILSQSGLTSEQVEYNKVANQDNDLKYQYLSDQITGKNHEQVLEVLARGRKESVTGDVLTSDDVLKNLYDEGIINSDEFGQLKKIKYTNNGTLKQSKGSGKKKITGVSFDFNLKSKTTKPFRFKRPTVRSAPVNLLPKSNLKALTFKGKPLKFKK